MSGVHNGVQEKFREEVLQAIYIHCHAHRLNLVLMDCVRKVNLAGDFLLLCRTCTSFSQAHLSMPIS